MPKRAEAELHSGIRSPLFLVTTLWAIDVPTSPSLAETLWTVKLNKLHFKVAEQEKVAVPLCRQVPKYGR